MNNNKRQLWYFEKNKVHYRFPEQNKENNINKVVKWESFIAQKMKFSIKDFFSKWDQIRMHCVKGGHIWNFSGPGFSSFGLNTEIYRVNLCSQSKCGKMRTRKTSNTDTFHAVWSYLLKKLLMEDFTSLFPVLLVFEKIPGRSALLASELR